MASKLASGASGASKKAGSSSNYSPYSTSKSSSSPSSSSSSSKSPAKAPTKASTTSKSSPVSKGSSGVSKSVARSLTSSSGSSSSGGGSTSQRLTSRDNAYITPRLMDSLSSSSSSSGRASTTSARDAYARADASGRPLSPTVRAALAQEAYAKADARGRPVSPTGNALKLAARSTAEISNPDSSTDNPGSLLDFLQTPYERRVERAGGAPFEGVVDWDGIGAALFGGESAAERDAMLKLSRTPPDPSRYTPYVEPLPGALSYEMFDDYVNSEAFGPKIDIESGFIQDPETGAYYRPDLLPSNEVRLAAEPSGIQLQLPSFAPLEGLAAGIQAESDRWNGNSRVPLPRPDPRGGISAMLPGQVEGGRAPVEIEVIGGNPGESDEARYARENPVVPPKEKTVFDSVVEGAGGLLEHTALGSVVKNLFPDLWYGAGESIKSLDDGVTYGGTGARTNFQDSASGGSLIEQPSQYAYAPLPFPDVNGNGIDDRLEGIGFMGSQPINWGARQVRFPTTPPYDPGRSGEFSYFTGQGYAEGGMVDPMQDPRMELIADTEDVLEDIAEGEPADAEDAEILRAFVAQFGDDALRALNDQVMAGMKMRPSRSRETGSPRLIEGPGTETSDSIPAMIEDAPGGPQPAALSDGEVVIPANAVRAAGQGDREKGAAQLMALSDMLVNGQ